MLVNFWATWCKPCRTEMPEIISAYQAHRGDGLEVLAVNLTDQESLKDVGSSSPNSTFHSPCCWMGKVAVWRLYGQRGVPTSVFIDSAGIVRLINQPVSHRGLERGLGEILPGP